MNIGLAAYARLIVIPILAMACASCRKNESAIMAGDVKTQEKNVHFNEHQTGSIEIEVVSPLASEDNDFTGFSSLQADPQLYGKFGYIFGDYTNHRRLKMQRRLEIQQDGELDGDDQPATAPQLKSEDKENPKPESDTSPR